MNTTLLGWTLHKLAINRMLDHNNQTAVAEAARKLHDIHLLTQLTKTPQEALARIKQIIDR